MQTQNCGRMAINPKLKTITSCFRYYTWKGKQKKWERRSVNSTSKVLGRMHNFSPRLGELYYLRLLLIYSKGAESFDDVKEDCETFRECCENKGLLEDDKGTTAYKYVFSQNISLFQNGFAV